MVSTSSLCRSADNASRLSFRSSTSKHLILGNMLASNVMRSTWLRARGQTAEELRDLLQAEHQIVRLPLERGKHHHGRQRRIRLLDDRQSAGVVHGRETRGPILVCPRQNDAEQMLAVNLRGRVEQHVDRGTGMMNQIVDRQRQLRTLVHQQVIVRGREVYGSGQDGLLVLRFAHCECAFAREDLDKQAGRSRGRCSTTKTATCAVAGTAGRSADNACTPPADAPIATARIAAL